jgi:hypothetical protein
VAFSVARAATDFCRQRPSGFDLDRPSTPVKDAGTSHASAV